MQQKNQKVRTIALLFLRCSRRDINKDATFSMSKAFMSELQGSDRNKKERNFKA